MEDNTISKWGIGPAFLIPVACFAATMLFARPLFPEDLFVKGEVSVALRAAGTAMVFFGLYLWLSSAFIIRHHISAGRLYRGGVYRIVRHPIYSGIWFVFSGAMVFLCIWPLLLFPAASYIYLKGLLKREETALVRMFGDDYLDYMAEVGGVLPLLHTGGGRSTKHSRDK